MRTNKIIKIVSLTGALGVALTLAGCITSPVWEYGATKTARATKLPACENGMLENGEDGDNQIMKLEERDGYWFGFADQWGSIMEPRRFALTKGGKDENSAFAANIKGKLAPSGDSIYAGMGFAFTNPQTPFDISSATGIRFWAKGPGLIRFKITDRNTDPQGDRCTDCYNDFGVNIYLQDEWKWYTIRFDQMAQKPGWGDRAPSLDTEGVFAVQWLFDTAGAEFDIWVDEVELVGCNTGAAE